MSVKRAVGKIHKVIMKNTVCADRIWFKSILISYIRGLLVFFIWLKYQTKQCSEISSPDSKECFKKSVQCKFEFFHFVFFLELTVNYRN